ncbi:putative F-box protein At5g55150 [Silene latifolia]|uniref:putative F-box protein At5g55150 n=1 Tax=Silene latifolia TaxID=37657 RepID=UPI003D785CB8
MAADWSALPLDLLGAIAFKLESFKILIYFSSVCRSWNCASSSIKHQWMAMATNLNNNKCYSSNLPETFGTRFWGTPYGWVAVARGDHTVHLINPITKANISFPSLEPILNLHETNAKYFNDWLVQYFLTRVIVLKVSHEFVIMIIHQSDNYITFARQGDESWTDKLIKEICSKIRDVVAMDDHVLVEYDDGAIAYWNVKKFYGLEAIKPMDYSPGTRHEIFKGPPAV